jgi:hypothetical protein
MAGSLKQPLQRRSPSPRAHSGKVSGRSDRAPCALKVLQARSLQGS